MVFFGFLLTIASACRVSAGSNLKNVVIAMQLAVIYSQLSPTSTEADSVPYLPREGAMLSKRLLRLLAPRVLRLVEHVNHIGRRLGIPGLVT